MIPVRITLTFEAGIEDMLYEDAIDDVEKMVAILEQVTSLTGNEFDWIGKITAETEEIESEEIQ